MLVKGPDGILVVGSTKITAGRCVAAIPSKTPKPSVPGIWTSRNTKSGLCSQIAAIADGPSAASPNTSKLLSALSRDAIRRRASGSSSTISVRMVIESFRRNETKRNADSDYYSTAFRIGHFKRLPLLAEPPTVRKKRHNGERVAPAIRVQIARKDAECVELGRRGEEWIVSLEKERLLEAGRRDLAEKVIWVSRVEGDGLGYDVRSFEVDGQQIFIEVKTTNGGECSNLLITSNELAVSDRTGKQFRLYRVFDFSRNPRVYVPEGPLTARLNLTPRSYSA